jgi:pimeloyl-ACP methyl ester carboxylesterase
MRPAPPGHWSRYRLEGGPIGHPIDVYAAHDAQPKPVVILIHGSGCAPLMTQDPDGSFHDTSLFQDLVAPRLSALHFVMVDKRGVEPVRFSAAMTQRDRINAFEEAGRSCSAEYIQNVTKQSRVADIIATTVALEHQPWAREIILAGHSEGTHVVTGVLRAMQRPNITAAGLFASAGPIPFFGGYVARGAGDRGQFQSVFDRIRMLQRADDDFIYEGLPARRWRTFWLDSTPIEDVRDSTVPLFVAQGGRDDTTLSADLFTLEAVRQQPNRPIRYVVVQDANHSFATPDGRSRLADVVDDFLRWALDANRESSLGQLK